MVIAIQQVRWRCLHSCLRFSSGIFVILTWGKWFWNNCSSRRSLVCLWRVGLWIWIVGREVITCSSSSSPSLTSSILFAHFSCHFILIFFWFSSWSLSSPMSSTKLYLISPHPRPIQVLGCPAPPTRIIIGEGSPEVLGSISAATIRVAFPLSLREVGK